ncbi:hypothetical protein Hanom_Chr13g01185871 [Helianthus anomalus]
MKDANKAAKKNGDSERVVVVSDSVGKALAPVAVAVNLALDSCIALVSVFSTFQTSPHPVTPLNIALKKNEKELKTTIQTLIKDNSELKKTILNKQIGINNYIHIIDETKTELAHARCQYNAIKLKLDSYSNSRYVLDHIIDVQKKKCIGYQACPRPVRHNYTKMR